jgi:polo-like kinase 1
VVKFIRFFEDKDNVYIMLELCSNQSLNELIKRRKKMTEIEVKYYVQQLVKGMQYMHQTKVIHRE